MLDLQASLKAWQSYARVGGTLVDLASDLPRRRLGYDQARSTCDISRMQVPDDATGQSLIVDVGWNGQTVRYFSGTVDSPGANAPQLARVVKGVDALGSLRKRFATPITWNGRAWMDAVFDVLIQCGIPQVAAIDDPGFLVGAEQPITVGIQESPAKIFQELLDYAGRRAWVAPDGGIHIDNVDAIASGTPARLPNGTPIVYAFGATGNELGITGSSWVIGSPERLVSSVTVAGPTLASGITPSATRLLNSKIGEPWSQSYRLLQDGTTAGIIAERELTRRARNRKLVQFAAPFNPYLLLGQTILFRDPSVGIDDTTPGVVWAVDTTLPGMTVTLVIGATEVSGFNPNQLPISIATVQIEQENIILDGQETSRYFVQCDGTQSYDPDGQVMTWTWDAPGGTPTSSTDVAPLFLYDSLTGQVITLTVEDDTGQAASVQVPLDSSDQEILTRELNVAEGTIGYSLRADGRTWQTYDRAGVACTAVPTFGEAGTRLSGWNDGTIYQLVDDQLVLVATLPL